MTDRDALLQQIAGDVTALVEPRTHTEPYTVWTSGRHRKFKAWRSDHAGLLDQLRAQVPPGSSDDMDGAGGPGGFESSPPLVVDALDRLMAIEAGSARVLTLELGHDLRETVEDNLRGIVGQATGLPLESDVKRVAGEVHRWHGWAATLTGWESPPWRPHVPCPLCETGDSLRINLLQKRAICMACAAIWEEADGSIGLLADYIKACDTEQMRIWEQGCTHSWRLTTVGPDGIRACCQTCHATDSRQAWPKGTPVQTDLDEQMRSASA